MEPMQQNGIGIRGLDFLKKFLSHRRLPIFLAIGAVLVMLPALKLGLIADDLPQRAVELRADQLPPRMSQTGNPADSGKFSTILFDLFGADRNPQTVAVMKNYGTLPWWTPDDLRLSLCRSVAALTHWIDYRLFPDSPLLMHAHNIAWFAAVVFVVTMVYRKLIGTGWAAGLAALLFLLDANIYFPAAFVANRGYFLALFFGLLCLYEHHQWRSAKSRSAMWLSALFLAVSILGEESGVSMFAFILAYALALETGNIRCRALSILPSVLVITVWWFAYKWLGYGMSHLGICLDPAQTPLRFIQVLIPRDMIFLGSQLTGVPPEILFVIKPSLHPAIIVLYGIVAIAALLIFLPWVRRDKMIAFWFVAMILAAVPEAVLLPLSKNFSFIAIGAFGLIASFVAGLFHRPGWLLERRGYKMFAWVMCVLLLLVHVPGAIAKRIAVVKASAFGFAWASRGSNERPNLEDKNLIIVNHPVSLESYYVPGYAAYYHRSLPKTLRVLAPACTGFDVQRTDDKTLLIQSHGPDLFSCDDLGPLHIVYFFNAADRLLLADPQYKKWDRYQLKGLTVEILDLDISDLPSRVAFHFDNPLDSPAYRWFWFNWRTFSTEPFKVPAIGQSVIIPGPSSTTDVGPKKIKSK
jgi:hypothetical protein